MLPSVIAVLLLLPLTCGQNPAVQVTLNNKGLQYGKHLVAGWIQEKLELITLPDIRGEVGIGIFGSVDYTLTGITVSKCDFPEPSVDFFQEASGLKTSASGLNVAIKGGWNTHYGIIHDHGSFTMAIFGVDVTSVVNLGADSDGRLSITSVSCDAQVGGVDVHFYGGASWIFRPFVSHFKGRIRSQIESKICPTVNESIVNLEQHLQSMNVSFDVNEDLIFDLPLTGVPVINASSLILGLKGEFYSITNHTEPPFVPQPFTMPQQQGCMFSLGLSEFTLNSALYRYYSAGQLQALINDSMIPPSCPVHLNTSSMGPFIPQLPRMFPDLPMTLNVYARDLPLFSFQPGALTLGLQGAVKAFAIQPNQTWTPLFKLNIDIQFSTKLWVTGGKLKGSMIMDNFTLTLVDSEIGPFETTALEKSARIGMTLALAKVNAILGKGFDLPKARQAQLVNTVLEVNKGFIAIFSDAQVLLTGADFN